MRCPVCSSVDDKVVDSRLADDGAAIRRRRECLACNRRFTTFERLEEAALITRQTVADAAGGLPARKGHAAALAVETLREALKNQPH